MPVGATDGDRRELGPVPVAKDGGGGHGVLVVVSDDVDDGGHGEGEAEHKEREPEGALKAIGRAGRMVEAV